MALPPHHELVERLARALPARSRAVLELDGVRRAAVAVLLVNRGGITHVPFTVRSSALVEHAGQVSLPGGRPSPEDASLTETALRETFEELGVPPASLRVLGPFDDVVTSTGYAITPVIAAAMSPPSYLANPAEVAEVFEVPLSLFGDPAAAELLGTRDFRGIRYPMRSYSFEGRRIWGATARVLETLLGGLRSEMVLEEEDR
ncbi:MAG TPA: CoA pyrophosphatase [Kofleriaceae bacterium]|nr:CoA pyrophosphatase [Kofleriaceae bacterium]